MAPSPPPGLLQRLPHDVLVDLFVRLEARDIGRLAATCRLLQYGQSSPQTPNPVEVFLRYRARLDGWSGTLPVDARRAVQYFLRIAWQDELEFHSISAGQEQPISFFVDDGGSLRACGVEMTYFGEIDHDHTIGLLLHHCLAAPPGSLGFGYDMSNYVGKEEPTLVPAPEGVRVRRVAVGGLAPHTLALTDEGQVYMWGPVDAGPGGDECSPTLFDEVSKLKPRRVAASTSHAAAITEYGHLYTWLHDTERYGYGSKEENVLGAGYPLRDSNDVEVQPFSPKRVEALDSMCIVSVAAGNMYTIVVTVNGVVFPAGCPYLGLATVLSALGQLQLGCSPPCCHTKRRPVPDPPLGRVFSFGSGEDGMLGHGSTETQVLPKEVEAIRGVDVASVCAGQSQVLALTYTGGVYSWRNNDGHPPLRLYQLFQKFSKS
jgi:hypothetical protein